MRTQIQHDILLFIHHHIMENGFPPSIREIASRLEGVSRTVVASHIDSLTDRGLLDRKPGISRGITITEQGRQALGLAAPQPSTDCHQLLIEIDLLKRENAALRSQLDQRVS